MDTNQNYHPRKYRKNDEKEIVKLLKVVFDEWPSTDFRGTAVDHWKWKYLDYPLQYNNTVVAESEGKIIGVMHGTSHQVKVGNKIYNGQVGSDTAVHPKHRRMGVYTSISKLKNKQHFEYGYNIMYWQTSNPILLNAQSWEGHEIRSFSHPLITLVRIIDIEKHLKVNTYDKSDIILKYGYLGSKVLNKFKRKNTQKNDEFDIQQISQFDFEINNFWENVKDSYDFIVVKTMDYLNWRYCDPRGGGYQILLAKDQDQILGYVVYKLNQYRKSYPIGSIIDVIALPERNDVVEILIDEAVNKLDSYNVNVIYAKIIRGHPCANILKKCGFVDARKKTYISYSPIALEDNLKKLSNAPPNRIHFQFGESEQF